MPRGSSFRAAAIAVLAYAVAMAYLESAVVVYLQGALGLQVGGIFPLRPPSELGNLAAIEAGREAATLLMIGAVGWLAGRTPLERLAWAAVVFGAWDIGYYGWLFVFSGWPPTLDTTDLLFLLPVPWVGPVWSPVAVSCALVGFGLAGAWSERLALAPEAATADEAVARPAEAAARVPEGVASAHGVASALEAAAPVADGRARSPRARHARARLTVTRAEWLAGLAGGLVVIVSYTLDAGRVMAGGLPGPYPWPVFAVGMALAMAAGVRALRRAAGGRATARIRE